MAMTRRSRWTLAAHVILAALALGNAGCLLVAAGVAGGAAAGYAYYQGKLCMAYDANFEDTHSAVKTALNELGMPLVKEEQEKHQLYIESRTSDNDRVRIYLDAIKSPIPAEGLLTRVCIRVATFGDHPVSHTIFDQIGRHLVVVPLTGAPNPPSLGAPQSIAPQAAPNPAVPPESPPPPLAQEDASAKRR